MRHEWDITSYICTISHGNLGRTSWAPRWAPVCRSAINSGEGGPLWPWPQKMDFTRDFSPLLGCPRKLGSLVSNWVISPTYKWCILGL